MAAAAGAGAGRPGDAGQNVVIQAAKSVLRETKNVCAGTCGKHRTEGTTGREGGEGIGTQHNLKHTHTHRMGAGWVLGKDIGHYRGMLT